MLSIKEKRLILPQMVIQTQQMNERDGLSVIHTGDVANPWSIKGKK